MEQEAPKTKVQCSVSIEAGILYRANRTMVRNEPGKGLYGPLELDFGKDLAVRRSGTHETSSESYLVENITHRYGEDKPQAPPAEQPV